MLDAVSGASLICGVRTGERMETIVQNLDGNSVAVIVSLIAYAGFVVWVYRAHTSIAVRSRLVTQFAICR